MSRSRRAEKREERDHTGAVSEEQVIQGPGPNKEIDFNLGAVRNHGRIGRPRV